MIGGHRRDVSRLVALIATDTGTKEPVIWDFIGSELRRVHRENIAPRKLDLVSLEKQLDKLEETEKGLHGKITRKAEQIKSATANIESNSSLLDAHVVRLGEKEREVENLRRRLDKIKAALHETDTTKKQLEYEVIIKNHTKRERNDKSFRRTMLFLSFLTVLAVAVALLLIQKK